MVAFLDRDGVPLSLFQNATREAMLFEGPDLPHEIENLEDLVQNPFNQVLVMDGAIVNLRERALLKLNDDTSQISCHHLIRHAVVKSMNDHTKLETLSRVVFLLNASFPTQEDGNPLHTNPEDDKWIAAAEGNLAVSLMASGRAEEAYEIISRLRLRDDMQSNLDVYLRNICLCLLILGRIDEALSANNEALQVARTKRGDSSEQVAICYFDLANIYIQRGNTSAALDALQECLNRRKASMPLHQVTAFTLHKIGDTVATENNYSASIPFYEQALEILTRCECHPGSVCRTTFALSSVCQLTGDEEMYEKFMRMGKSTAAEFSDDETLEFETAPGYYDRFVQVGLR
ncbi:hypothetical protein ABKA04_007678 [Annulohypoxylon sp. FPYF3050]